MGEVYRARDTRLQRDVALKFLSEQLTRDPTAVERFVREAQAASALNHPHIVTVHDIGEVEGGRFIVMELVEGRTLRALVQERPLLDEVMRIGEQIARALAAAHTAGIVHRDIKPENVMVRHDGYVKVLDFGLARLLPPQLGLEVSAVATAFTTQAGTLIGTTRYMSPEQTRGETVSNPSDVFSLGLVLYELATGHHPFSAGSTFGVLENIGSQPAMPPSHHNSTISPALDALLLEMLEKNPGVRPTAIEVAERLPAQGHGPMVARTAPAPPVKRHTVGRERERAELGTLWRGVVDGIGMLVCIAGEPGIGKTTLVEDLLSELASSADPLTIARGRCSERLAGTEAYLPFLEALGSLLRTHARAPAARLLKLFAPSWFVEVVPPGDIDTPLVAPGRAASQERMKREMGNFLQEFSRIRPLVLFLDDVHWADVSTIDLLAYLATRFAETRILIVVTYRQSELLIEKHPLVSVKLDLEARGACRDIALDYLSAAEVATYLGLEFPNHRFPDAFASLIHAKTEGSPLFMTGVIRYLRDRNVIVSEDSSWVLAESVPLIKQDLPASVRSMIQRKIDQLSEDQRGLLTIASVQGYEFDAPVVAQVAGLEEVAVEERLDVAEHVHGFVQRIGEYAFPDGTLSTRYRFVHVLYQNALMASLTPVRRISNSRAVATALERRYQDQPAAIANQLAVLFESARDLTRAADFFLLAAQHAARVFAHQEAVRLSSHGLDLLKALPAGAGRAQLELDLLTTLGLALLLTRGFGAAEVQEAYARARALCRERGEGPELFRILWGLWWFHEVRGDLETAHALADDLLTLAERQRDAALLVQAHRAPAQTCFWLGKLDQARRHMELGLSLYDPQLHGSLTLTYGQDPAVGYRGFLILVLWLQGHADRALCTAEEALTQSRTLSHPFTQAFALSHAGILHQFRREPHATLQRAQESIVFSTEHGFPFFRAIALMLQGWAEVELGRIHEGMTTLRAGVSAYQTTGAIAFLPYFLSLLAEALGRAGDAKQALNVLDEALRIVDRTGERVWEPELHRLQGEIVLQEGAPRDGEAESCFRSALDLSRRQGAKSLELRAATSLTRLLARSDRAGEASRLLADIYGWFTEGFDTPDVREAKALLDELA